MKWSLAQTVILAIAAATPLAALPQGAPAADGGAAAQEIIRALEKLMFPDAKATATLDFKAGARSERYQMVYYTRERNQKIIVRVLAPATSAGNDILMVDQSVWTYDKGANRVMKVASNQSFGGTGFSYGDIVRLNFSDNYDATLTGETATEHRLELIAKNRSAPYYRIEMSVAKPGGWPLKGVYYARNGSVVKEIAYSDVRDLGNGKKPVALTVSSPLDPAAVNTLTIVREEARELPAHVFNKRNLEVRAEENL